MSEHTDGPWRVVPPPPAGDRGNPWSVYGPDGLCIAILSVLRRPAAANARLIAAAPEMYEALVHLVKVESHTGFTLAAWIEEAERLIAKAEGRQP